MEKVALFGALLGATGLQLPRSESPWPLKVFAATFNAGNSQAAHEAFRDEGFKTARDQILKGSGGADIVIVGLQEFRDKGEHDNAGEECTLPIQYVKAGFNSTKRDKICTPSSLFAPEDTTTFDNFRVTYYSGTLCHLSPLDPHFNTALYVHVSKKSESDLVITHKPHRSERCINPKREPAMGCSIENGDRINFENLAEEAKKKHHKNECGKVVNLLAFEIRRGGAVTGLPPLAVLCVMNTHMSFAKTAEARMGFIAAAMDEAKEAKCNKVVFVGDFNSRLHCHGEEGHVAHHKGQTVKEVLDEFKCNNGVTCDLEGSQHRDELRQFLTKDEIHCHEEKVESKRFVNTVKGYGYKEPAVPTFLPSYKLVDLNKVDGNDMQEAGQISCRGPTDAHETMCIGNKDGHDKHKPAWTDRVLIKGELYDTFERTYERRVVAQGFKTDHGAVIAKFAFKIP